MSTIIPNSKIQDGGVALTGDEVVISGISGIFPKSNNIPELMNNLYNKVDMITEENVMFDHADVPRYSGRISGTEKFDAQFFRVPHKQAESLEPMCRKMLEQSYCAMYDAGVNPVTCKGKSIGVFNCCYNSECAAMVTSNLQTNAFLISGGSKCMYPNRISYWLDSKGPSYSIDCPSGSLICLDQAYNCIKDGTCEAALVSGSDLTVDTVLSVNMRNAGFACLDGKTKCFDKYGDGYVKSQAVSVIFLQKAKDAKRIYAEVRGCKIAYGLKINEGFSHNREPNHVIDLLTNFYNQSGVSPDEVEYVEASGAANPQADANELEAIAHMFAKNKPVLVGSVKSNMGDAESAHGVCALTKLCLAYHTGKLAGNLHYNHPLDIPAIEDGKIKVLTDTTPFNRGVTAINDFLYTGLDCHVIVNGHYKPKDVTRYETTIPRLVLVSGRLDTSVQYIFDELKSKPLDSELIGMLHDIYKTETPGFTCRGYCVLDSKDKETISLAESTEFFQGARPPLWLLFSGMGSQWAEMGKELLRIPIFAASIEKCRIVLEPTGVDIVRILTSPEKTIFDSILNSFVGIAAVQIGLVDILKAIGLVPDFIIGHSAGEIGCAYFDGCFSAEETILVAYTRGLVSIQAQLIEGSMAAVGLGYNNILSMCPPEIDIACHNSSESCTISGPKDAIDTFVSELTSKGIFAKSVPTGNIAFHSRYIQNLGPTVLKKFKEIIKNPVKRSNKWITSSWLEEKQESPEAELSSAEYHTNNLLSPVYFEEAARKIPYNAVVVEVAPHGLMQAIVRKSHPSCTHIPLTRRGQENPLKFLLEAFGKIYQQGFNIDIGVLYLKIEYPVSTETSLLSHFVQWYHDHNWAVHSYNMKETKDNVVYASRTIPVSVQDDDYKFFAGHLREGNIVFPESAVLYYVWNTLAMFKGVDHKKLPVTFHEIQFYAEVVIGVEETVDLKFEIFRGNQYFEVTRDDILIAKGFIEIVESTSDIEASTVTEETFEIEEESDNIPFTSGDIYKIFKLKGFCYQDEFKSIHTSSSRWNSSLIKMTENWIILLDSMIQLQILASKYGGISVPKLIRKLTIDTTYHSKIIENINCEHNYLQAQFCKSSGVIQCGGVTICNIIFNDKPIKDYAPDVLENLVENSNETEEKNSNHWNHKNCTNKIKEYELVIEKPGDIGSLKWVEVIHKENNTDRIKVCFASPSMKDAQNAVGLTSQRKFGMDFSGIDTKGNRVMGLVDQGALSSTVVPDSDLLWPVPKHWTLQEAATILLPYVHALYCLILRNTTILEQGNVVFVSGGSGALGQAVISICLSMKCKVYTTVSDIQKKRFLMRLFPNLDHKNIGLSSDMEFFNLVVRQSENQLFDLVINCAIGHLRELSMKCVDGQGTFIDISTYDSMENHYFGMYYLLPTKSYVHVNLSNLFRPENVAERKMLQRLVSEGIAKGMIRPISFVEYDANEVEKAFRLLSQRRHRGRAVIRVADIDNQNVIPRSIYPSEGVYLVVNDDSETDFGIKLTTRLVKCGAKSIIFHQKHRKVTGFLQAALELWKKLGAAVTVLSNNFETISNCQVFFKKVGSRNEIFGIFVVHPKYKESDCGLDDNKKSNSAVVHNLNEVSENNCPNLKYFVIFARNSETNIDDLSLVEEICDEREKRGLPALLIRTESLEEEPENKNSTFRMMSGETAIKSMEICLSKNYTKALAYNKKKNTNEFLEVLTKIGTNNYETIDNLRVEDLILSEVSIKELQLEIKENYLLSLPIPYIKEMTIYRLRNLSEYRSQKNIHFNRKLGAFLNFVDHDQINATEIFVPMITQISSSEGCQNLHAKAVNLIILPGFDGHHHTFESLAKSLKIRATTLQLGPDSCNKSIFEIALDLKQRILSRFILEPKFYLLGYSFGMNIALEIAALLEKDGLVGVVYCLDSSPDALRAQLEAYLGPMTEAQLQNAIIKHMFYVFSGKTCERLEENIAKTNEWSEKVTKCVENLKDAAETSNEYKKSVIDTFYKRICLARNYNPEIKLKSKIILLKGIPHPDTGRLAADYGLSKYTKDTIKILHINSDVVSAPKDSRVPNFVNRFLDPVLLEEFKRKNLCDSYITPF